MRLDFIVNVNDKTKGVSEQGFGLILAYDHEHDIPYTEISNASDLLEKGVTVDDPIYKIVQKIFMAKPSPQTVAVYGKEAFDASEVKTNLSELINEQKNDWFSLVSTDNSDETIKALSEFALANDKIYYATTQNLEIFETIESKNASIGYHDNPEDYLAEGLAANMSVALPGSITAKFEEIQGSLPANITLTQLNAIEKENGYSYIRSKGRNYISEGKTTDGSYLDVVLGAYFIKFRLEEALFLLAMNNGKIPYSDRGIGLMVGEVESVLQAATRQGIILEEGGKGVYTITALRRSEVLNNEVANRFYGGLSVQAVVAGAVHSATINIDLVLSEEE